MTFIRCVITQNLTFASEAWQSILMHSAMKNEYATNSRRQSARLRSNALRTAPSVAVLARDGPERDHPTSTHHSFPGCPNSILCTSPIRDHPLPLAPVLGWTMGA